MFQINFLTELRNKKILLRNPGLTKVLFFLIQNLKITV